MENCFTVLNLSHLFSPKRFNANRLTTGIDKLDLESFLLTMYHCHRAYIAPNQTQIGQVS